MRVPKELQEFISGAMNVEEVVNRIPGMAATRAVAKKEAPAWWWTVVQGVGAILVWIGAALTANFDLLDQ